MQYEKRPKFWAMRYIRTVLNSLSVCEMGHDSFTLIVTIAMQEDRFGYSKPVNFWNEQLAELCGFRSVKQLQRARDRAISSGWLEYRSGFKSIPAVYRSVIPGQMPGAFLDNNDLESARNPPGIRQESVQLPSRTHTHTHKERAEEGQCDDLDKPPEVVSISPEDEWKMVRLEAWAKKLAPLCGTLNQKSWQRYKGLVDQYGLDMVATVALNNSGRFQWADDLAAILSTCQQEPAVPQDPNVATAIGIVKAKGWKACVDKTGLGGVDSESDVLECCVANPGFVDELIEWQRLEQNAN